MLQLIGVVECAFNVIRKLVAIVELILAPFGVLVALEEACSPFGLDLV